MTSFAERLQRIEATQYRPMKDRLLAGISEEQRKMETAPKADAQPEAQGKGLRPIRFVVGFVLMYAATHVLANMSQINGMLDASEFLAPYAGSAMIGVAVAMLFLMGLFVFKLLRATFRLRSEPGRLVFATGMVAGLALGMGMEPAEFTGTMMAELDQTALLAKF